jgi:lysyl-tRNA synthetase class 2
MSQQSDLNLKTYQPTCSIEALKARAKLYQTIRTFLQSVMCWRSKPIISQAGVTDVHLASVRALRHIEGKERIQYLQTSPEFAMNVCSWRWPDLSDL